LYTYIYTQAYMYIYIYTHICICTHIPTHIYIHTCMHNKHGPAAASKNESCHTLASYIWQMSLVTHRQAIFCEWVKSYISKSNPADVWHDSFAENSLPMCDMIRHSKQGPDMNDSWHEWLMIWVTHVTHRQAPVFSCVGNVTIHAFEGPFRCRGSKVSAWMTHITQFLEPCIYINISSFSYLLIHAVTGLVAFFAAEKAGFGHFLIDAVACVVPNPPAVAACHLLYATYIKLWRVFMYDSSVCVTCLTLCSLRAYAHYVLILITCSLCDMSDECLLCDISHYMLIHPVAYVVHYVLIHTVAHCVLIHTELYLLIHYRRVYSARPPPRDDSMSPVISHTYQPITHVHVRPIVCVTWPTPCVFTLSHAYGVAAIGRLLEIIGLFRKRALWRDDFAKETYNFKESTNRSQPPFRTFSCVRGGYDW